MRVAVAVLVLGYAWWAVGLAPFSASATAAVLTAGAVAMGLGWRSRLAGDRPAPGQVTAVAGWVALAAVAAAWQLAAYLQHPRRDHPTLSSLTNALLDSQLLRTAAFVLWIATAFELARR